MSILQRPLPTTIAHFIRPGPMLKGLLKRLFVYLIEVKRLTRRDQKLGSPIVGFSIRIVHDFEYTFDHFTNIIEGFAEKLG